MTDRRTGVAVGDDEVPASEQADASAVDVMSLINSESPSDTVEELRNRGDDPLATTRAPLPPESDQAPGHRPERDR